MQFRYRLEGHDTSWQDAGNRRQAFYTNLGPGTFQFFVKASNNNGVWNENGTQLLFSIAPAYYQTSWFRLACAALVGTLVLIGFVLHSRRVRREETRLRNVIEGLPTLAFSVYPDGSLDLVNQRWLDYFGVVAGRTRACAICGPPFIRPTSRTHLSKWQAALASGETVRERGAATAAPRASTAGSSCARFRCVTRTARYCAGTARSPTSRSASAPKTSASGCGVSKRRSRIRIG
jgi:hypothetical protein